MSIAEQARLDEVVAILRRSPVWETVPSYGEEGGLAIMLTFKDWQKVSTILAEHSHL
jgi:hypothetical protein